MDKSSRALRLQEFKRLCIDRGERCTPQRQIILETVLGLDNHPSADQVYDVVIAHLPDMARTTVYRTLEHLARMGVITKACHPGRVARFDARTEIHHHLVCLRCNEFVDFEDEGLNAMPIPDTSASEFNVIDFRVQLRGICKTCQQKEKKEESR